MSEVPLYSAQLHSGLGLRPQTQLQTAVEERSFTVQVVDALHTFASDPLNSPDQALPLPIPRCVGPAPPPALVLPLLRTLKTASANAVCTQETVILLDTNVQLWSQADGATPENSRSAGVPRS